MKDLVSVVTPAYRLQSRFLAKALESILGQSYSPLELVLVHDGSVEILEILQRLKSEDRLRAYQEKRPGYISALNQGVELSRGEYVGFCDSDDVLNRDHIKMLADTLRRYPDTGLVFDNLTYSVDWNDFDQDALNLRDELDGKPLISSERARTLVERGITLQDVFMDNLISGPAFMVPRRVFESVGVFDDNVFLMSDLHLFYRIGAQFPLRYVDYIGVFKRVHAKNLTTTHPHYEYGVRSLENIREHYPEVCRRIGGVFNKKLSRKYYRLGLYCEREGDRKRAREMYRKAMVTRKLSLRYHWAYLRSTLAR
ncbi:MAG: glycosyltransferase family 2 protein [Candidatus Binatia bacterium]